MTGDGKRRLLWTDDDGPGRFRFEESRVRREGWDIEWASSLAEAMNALRRERFNVILLDQMLPVQPPRPPVRAQPNVWHGCRLLYWLRGQPWPATAPIVEDWEDLADKDGAPLLATTPVVLVSAFFDEDVHAALRHLEPNLPLVVKPVKVELLLHVLAEMEGDRRG